MGCSCDCGFAGTWCTGRDRSMDRRTLTRYVRDRTEGYPATQHGQGEQERCASQPGHLPVEHHDSSAHRVDQYWWRQQYVLHDCAYADRADLSLLLFHAVSGIYPSDFEAIGQEAGVSCAW